MSDHTRQCIYFNKPWLEFTGRTLAQELGNGWSEGVHPEDYEQCLNTYTAAFDARRHFNMEYRLRRHDGEYRWAYIQGVPRHTPDGVFIGYIGSCIDITERKQAELMVSLENQLLGMIASGVPTSTTLDMLLRFLEGLSPDMLCSILLLDADGVHLHHCSAPSLPEVYCRAIDGVAIGADVGSCGTAAFRREAVFVDDITSNPLWTDFKELALSHGLRACWSTPIFDAQSQVLGTFAIYHRQPCHPNALQQQLIKTATHIASIAISMKNIEAEKSKNAQRALHYKEILLQLSQQQFVNLPDHLRAITEAGAQALNVERIGIWTLHGNSLECCDLYLASVGEHQHIAPYILPDSSRYFIALQQREVIRAEDVRTDPRTTEFNKFFESKDISSVMDVPIWAHGHMVGVLGCDHTGTRRQWTDFEEDFARHLTAIVSVAMEEEERRQVEKTLRKSDKQYQENLEQRVAERTSELSTVNLELERARNVAESASEAKSLFLSRMSHELRTPLHAILGFSQLLKDGLSNATQDEINFLQQIQHSSQHLMDMINEVLDLARIEAGKLDLILEDIDLNDGICTECLALVQTIAEKNNIALHLKAGGNHPIVVYADRIRLKQVLLNLLSNAVKYNRPQGSVIMEYNTDAKVVRVTVTDTGKGIPENQHDRLFQPFTRIHRNYGNIE
ncbi:MAG: GAF domain-containing protein, partial [Gammaproteobacteria bacterium]